MPISIVLATVGVAMVFLGAKGFTREGLAFSKTKTLNGKTGRTVGTICIIVGALLAVIDFGFIAMLSEPQ
jgi:hypothetical protein